MKNIKLLFVAMLTAVCFACEDTTEDPTTPVYDYNYSATLEGTNDYDWTKYNQIIGIDFKNDSSVDITFEKVMFMDGMPELTMTINICADSITKYEDNVYGIKLIEPINPTLNGADASAYATFENLDFIFDSKDIICSFDIYTAMGSTDNEKHLYSFEYATTDNVTGNGGSSTPTTYNYSGTFYGHADTKYFSQSDIDVDVIFNEDNTVDIDLYGITFSAAMNGMTMYKVTVPAVSYSDNNDGTYSTVSNDTEITATYQMMSTSTEASYNSPITYVDFSFSASETVVGSMKIGGIDYHYTSTAPSKLSPTSYDIDVNNIDSTLSITMNGLSFGTDMPSMDITFPGVSYSISEGVCTTMSNNTPITATYVSDMMGSGDYRSPISYINFSIDSTSLTIAGSFVINNKIYSVEDSLGEQLQQAYNYSGNFSGNTGENYFSQDSIKVDIIFNEDNTIDLDFYGITFSAAMNGMTMYKVTVPAVGYSFNDNEYQTVSNDTGITATYQMMSTSTEASYSSPITEVDFKFNEYYISGTMKIGGIEYYFSTFTIG